MKPTAEELGKMAAFPQSNSRNVGMTKREYFAGLAMQGLLTKESSAGEPLHFVALTAVTCADHLLEKLAEE